MPGFPRKMLNPHLNKEYDMQKKVIHFYAEKTTPGALVFAERNGEGEKLKGDDGVVGLLYVRKVAVNGQPKIIRATLEFFDSLEELSANAGGA